MESAVTDHPMAESSVLAGYLNSRSPRPKLMTASAVIVSSIIDNGYNSMSARTSEPTAGRPERWSAEAQQCCLILPSNSNACTGWQFSGLQRSRATRLQPSTLHYTTLTSTPNSTSIVTGTPYSCIAKLDCSVGRKTLLYVETWSCLPMASTPTVKLCCTPQHHL